MTAELEITGDPRAAGADALDVRARRAHARRPGGGRASSEPAASSGRTQHARWSCWPPGRAGPICCRRRGCSVIGRLGPTTRVGREVAVLRVTEPPTVVGEPSDSCSAWPAHVRAGLRAAVDGLAPDPRGLVPGVVVGDERLMPPDLVVDAQTSGLTHLTAVSGANVTIVLAVVLTVARWLGARAYAIPAIGLLAIVAFVVLARPQPSVLRAAVMGAAVVVGLGVGARRRRLAPLLAAIVVAAPGRSVAGPVVRVRAVGAGERGDRGARRRAGPTGGRGAAGCPTPVAAAVAVPLAASLACAPGRRAARRAGQPRRGARQPAGRARGRAGHGARGRSRRRSPRSRPGRPGCSAELAGVPAAWIGAVARWCADLPYADGALAGRRARVRCCSALVTVVGAVLGPPAARVAAAGRAARRAGGRASRATQVVAPGWPRAGLAAGRLRRRAGRRARARRRGRQRGGRRRRPGPGRGRRLPRRPRRRSRWRSC